LSLLLKMIQYGAIQEVAIITLTTRIQAFIIEILMLIPSVGLQN